MCRVIKNEFYTVLEIENRFIWAETEIVLPVKTIQEAEEYIRNNFYSLSEKGAKEE